MPRLSPENFPDFFAATRPALLTPETVLVNLARVRGYPAFMHMRGQDPFNTVQGGTSIVETVQIRELQTFQWTSPGEYKTIRLINTDQVIEFPWRKGEAHTGWTDDAYRKNTAGDKVRVKKYSEQLRRKLKSEMIARVNDSFFSRPSFTTMENTAALPQGTQARPYSLFAHISEDPLRFAPPSQAVAGDEGPVWDEKCSLLGRNRSQAANYWLRNIIENYTPGMLADPFVGVRNAMQRMVYKLRFAPVDAMPEAFEGTELSDLICWTNTDGAAIYAALSSQANQRTKRLDDMGMGEALYFDDVPVVAVPTLDTERLDQTIGASAAYQNQAWPDGRPRYVFQNKRHLRWVFDGANMFNEKKPIQASANQADTWVVWMSSDFNLANNGFNRNGIVAPRQPLT